MRKFIAAAIVAFAFTAPASAGEYMGRYTDLGEKDRKVLPCRTVEFHPPFTTAESEPLIRVSKVGKRRVFALGARRVALRRGNGKLRARNIGKGVVRFWVECGRH